MLWQRVPLLMVATVIAGASCTLSSDLCRFSAERCDEDSTAGAGAAGASSSGAGAGAGAGAGGGATCESPEPTELAFPTAEGFGAKARGGRGGKVLHVTNLDDSGPGSLRDALSQAYKRIVVFDVSGVIDLQSDLVLYVENSYVTIAGQTSPGGIQLRGAESTLTFRGGFHDGIVRHLRVRPGGPISEAGTGAAVFLYGDGDPVYNVIIDHCDLMWSGGSGQLSVAEFVYDMTVQWNLIAEGFNVEPSYGGGTIVMTYDDEAASQVTYSFHHNLFSNNPNYNPFLATSAVFDYRNNITHNWLGNNAAQFGTAGNNMSAMGNFVKNLYLAGPQSDGKGIFFGNGASLGDRDRGGTRIYAEGNWTPVCDKGCPDDWDNGYRTADGGMTIDAPEDEFRAMEPFDAPPVKTDEVANLPGILFASVGATRPMRDSESQRIIDDAKDRNSLFRTDTGGPWPEPEQGTPPADDDEDGMADEWELAHGLDPTAKEDADALGCNGFPNVENYLNELAGDSIQ